METTNLILLRKKCAEDEIVFIAERSNFENMLLHDCYNEFGCRISNEEAEDYCLENSYCTELRKKFIEDYKKAGFVFDEENSIDDILESDNEQIVNFLASWKDKNESYTEAYAYNYFDGHNWKSIILDCDIDEYAEYEYEEGEDILKEFEGIEFLEHENGICKIETDNYIFKHSLSPSNPFLANVEFK